jgi:hypothetical protein
MRCWSTDSSRLRRKWRWVAVGLPRRRDDAIADDDRRSPAFAARIAAVDLLAVPTIVLKFLDGLLSCVWSGDGLVRITVTTTPTAECIARQITGALPWDAASQYFVCDRDSSYGAAAKRRSRAMGHRRATFAIVERSR